MNTTSAATQANVTVATIRTWCRYGAIKATKTSGRWNIDPDSLNHRISLSRRAAGNPVVFSIDTMTAIGGNRWTRNGHDRVYINDWTRFTSLEVHTYTTGNISWAAWDGQEIANRQAGMILGCIDKIWFDAADGKLHCRYGYGQSRVVDRETVWQQVVTGIRTAIAAL